MDFSRQEYSSGLLFPTPRDLPKPGIEPSSPALAGEFFTPSVTWEAPYMSSPQQLALSLAYSGEKGTRCLLNE